MKRWRARARGRVARIRKRTCHITVQLTELAQPVAAPEQPKAEAATAEEKPKRKPAAKKTTTAKKKASAK
jgi:large subunit ribosomal protein L22